jgi:hypothetical protein
MNTAHRNRFKELTAARKPLFESLENRLMMRGWGFSFLPNFVLPYTINGTQGNDYINVSYSNNAILGPRMTVQINSSPTWIAFPAVGQAIQINGLGGNDTIRFSGSGTANLYGGEGNDTLVSGSGNDWLSGDNGVDLMDGGMGADAFWGGPGADTVTYASRTLPVRIGVDGMANDGQPGENDNVASDVEKLVGGWSNDYINVNVVTSTGYHFTGGAGNDTLLGSMAGDIMIGGTGNDLMMGNDGDDYMIGEGGIDTVRGGWGRDLVSGGYDNDIVYGDAGIDTVYGDQGNDRLYGGADADVLYAGDGNDSIVAIGGGQSDQAWGQAGYDHFWMDAEGSERVMDATSQEAFFATHRVSAFERLNVNGQFRQAPTRELDGQAIVDPAHSGFSIRSFAGISLFSPYGPRPDDIEQRAAGDCYFLAPLAGLAKKTPEVIRRSIVDLGDGTFAVQFRRNGASRFVRVDADLPVNVFNEPHYSNTNSMKGLWVALMEKAWAFFRTGFGSYASTNLGHTTETFTAMGVLSSHYSHYTNGTDLAKAVEYRMSCGDAVTLDTKATLSGEPEIVTNHSYTVDRVFADSAGNYWFVLRNPWGEDGNGSASDGVDDGYITLSAARAFQIYSRITCGMGWGTLL